MRMRKQLGDMAAYWRLGRLNSAELVVLARYLLECGVDSPALRELARESQPLVSDVDATFARALTELAVAVPDWDGAWDHVERLRDERHARIVAADCLSGELDPIDFARHVYLWVNDGRDHGWADVRNGVEVQAVARCGGQTVDATGRERRLTESERLEMATTAKELAKAMFDSLDDG
jgi:hypothetical protein